MLLFMIKAAVNYQAPWGWFTKTWKPHSEETKCQDWGAEKKKIMMTAKEQEQIQASLACELQS